MTDAQLAKLGIAAEIASNILNMFGNNIQSTFEDNIPHGVEQ